MRRSKKTIVVFVVSIFLFVGLVGLIIVINGIDKQTADTTTCYTATVDRVEIAGTGKQEHAEIFVKEYETSLLVTTNISKNINMRALTELEEGQAVFFRIENAKISQMNEAPFIDIVSLETEAKPIFTLADYNAYMKMAVRPARIAAVVVAVLSLSVSVFCFFKRRLR